MKNIRKGNFTYIARVKVDITGMVHLDVIWDDMVVELVQDDTFVTIETKVALEDYGKTSEDNLPR